MEIPHDTVFVEVSSFEAVGYFTALLAREDFTVVVNSLQIAMSQAAYNRLEKLGLV